MTIGLYIHIPFCIRKCLYCDFPSVAGAAESYEAYTAALCREIAGRGGVLSSCGVDTVYIGGGTPTALPAALLAKVGDSLKSRAAVLPGAEFTVEANPGTLDAEKLAVLLDMGANRLSIGVQSFDDAVLTAIGRAHTAAQAENAVAAARAAGFGNVSVDLMYGLPGQSADSFRAGLEAAVCLPVEHISAYGLKVEEGTPFAALRAASRLDLPDEDEEEAMYELAVGLLPARGFHRYEISNFARPGAECRHNLRYWRCEPYIGAGAAAHSFVGGERLANIAAVGEYIRLMAEGGDAVSSRECSAPEAAMAEYVFLGLRTAAGVSFAAFEARFGISFAARYGRVVADLARRGLVEATAGRLRLTARGMKFGNPVFAAFLPE